MYSTMPIATNGLQQVNYKKEDESALLIYLLLVHGALRQHQRCPGLNNKYVNIFLLNSRQDMVKI